MHPFGGWSIPGDHTDVIVHSDQHDRMVFEFQPVEGEWGYMVHKSSSKLVHPYLGAVKPSIGTSLVIHSDRHAAALFAIDQVKNRILHKGGLFIHPEGGNANPDNGTKLVLYNTIHDGMRFITVNPNNINEVVDIYGNPHCSGKWEIINMVKTPKATHTYTVSFKVGRSKTESTTSSITMTWEVSMEATRKALTANASETVQKMIQRSSSATFSEEITQTHEIKGKCRNNCLKNQ